MQELTRAGTAGRVTATVLGAALLTLGTVVGTDDHFPFGPFRMYSTTDRLDAPVFEALVVGTDAAGRSLVLTENETGVRRAEVEGQLARFTADPALLQIIADAYHRRHPDGSRLTSITVVGRRHELSGGRPTGAYQDSTVATWQVRP